ncbi:MAG: amino acid dehydrogenase [Deltaproteobacteria bacterium HGW-Deltaproteobacteria-4]|nr:MAG: amino acid dehydrogenase [Deltaproteobacteria bacterium HGW-Deltaproteobacteria-4]
MPPHGIEEKTERPTTPAKTIHINRTTNRRWLRAEMNPYFFTAIADEPEALALLERELDTLRFNRHIVLADREKSLILATLNSPGSLYKTLQRFPEREISYAMFAHSTSPVIGTEHTLEIQRFEFDRKSNEEVNAAKEVLIPEPLRKKIFTAVRKNYPTFKLNALDRLLHILWINNEGYLRNASPLRIAQVLNVFHMGNRNNGLYLDVEPNHDCSESRVHFAVGNPPQRDFLLQVMEVFNRLDLGINRAYCLTISNGIHPYFLATFHVLRRDGNLLCRGDEIFNRLQQELANAQLLSTKSLLYNNFVRTGTIRGEDATLINAFIAFCHTNLAHSRPDHFKLPEVRDAFLSHPQISLQLTALFRQRLAPDIEERDSGYQMLMTAAIATITEFNTGHRHLDEIRRTIFHCALSFIRHTLKTNFFILEKQALAFRLDPAYLLELPVEAVADLPKATPFRITFFFNRFGFGYHIGFSDIARGGWRTVIARSKDDYVANAETLFRENFVLAHTQHLKNKDIYEGGSKLVTLLNAADLTARERVMETWRLYKLQYGITNAFLDIFVTEQGVAKHPAVVDYYRQEEAIELGPDENMHDEMIEAIADLSRRRGYILGIGIMSSKKIGINHKEYGVTSTGVVKFAEIAMREVGIDIDRDPYALKITGGPNGDVAGNALRLLLERSPRVAIRLILDGTAALFDPSGANHAELKRIILQHDLDAFDPQRLHPGGFLLLRSGIRRDGLQNLYCKMVMTSAGLVEEWIPIDQFARTYTDLVFTVAADLFIPAGGRPETIDKENCEKFFLADGTPSAQVIVEGANSFLTPEARVQLQRRGILIMRDASANKCGVISSSYEVIANLLLSNEEFLEHKETYVSDVLAILEKRAQDEAELILRRRRTESTLLCTEISDALSTEINANYARLFRFFQSRPELCKQTLYRRTILAHLPALIRNDPRLRQRIIRLPEKYRFAILAAEIGSSLVYQGESETDFADMIRTHLTRKFAHG